MNDKNKKRGGMYWIGDRPYPSVTEILKVVDKPALRYWFGKGVYQAMVVDPSLTEQQALAAPYESTKAARDRGSAVHSIVEAWENTERVAGLDGPFKGYAEAFQRWVDHNTVELVEHERTVHSDKYGYAGTLDIIVRMCGEKKPTLIDVKTGKDLYPEVHFQLSAYKQALEENGVEIGNTAALLLMEDGTYKFEIGKSRLDSFLACKVIWDGLNQELMEKATAPKQRKLL